MAKRVLSIEIGQQVTKAVVIDYLRKNPHVYNAFSFDTPEDTMEDGYIRDKEKMASVIREQIRDNGVKEKDVVFSIASSKIASREVVVPFVSENRLEELVNATAQDYFPVNLDEYTLAYSVLDTVKEKDRKSLKLLLLAAPDTLIQNYYALAEGIGVHIEALDYYGNGSMQVLQKHIVSGYSVCVQIGTLATMVSVIKEGQQIMQRTIPYGTNTIVDTIMENKELGCNTPVEAMEMLCRENVIYSTLDYEDIESIRSTRMTEDQWKRSHHTREARKAVTDAVGGILLSVIRVVDYFHSKYPGCELTNIYITGMGVKIRGIDVLFEKEMDLPVRRLEKLTNITFVRGFSSSISDQTEYIAAIGAAIEPIGFRLKSIAEKESRKEGMRMVKLVFGLSILTSLILLGSGWMGLHSAQTDRDDLQSQKDSLKYIEKVYDENIQAEKQFEEVSMLRNAIRTPNGKLKTLIEQLETNLPKNMTVTNLQSSSEGLNMTITTTTKISVAKLLMNLERIEGLMNLEVPSVTGEDTDSSATSYNFTVTANYTFEQYKEEEK